MIRYLGAPPTSFLERCSKTEAFFDENGGYNSDRCVLLSLLTSRRTLEAWSHTFRHVGRPGRGSSHNTGIIRFFTMFFAMGSSRPGVGRAVAQSRLSEVDLAIEECASSVAYGWESDSGLVIAGGMNVLICDSPSPLHCGCLYCFEILENYETQPVSHVQSFLGPLNTSTVRKTVSIFRLPSLNKLLQSCDLYFVTTRANSLADHRARIIRI